MRHDGGAGELQEGVAGELQGVWDGHWLCEDSKESRGVDVNLLRGE